MMQFEFESLLGDEVVSDKDYKDIEYVYQWHPSISEIDGKNEIATIYKIGGMRIIKDMIPTARKNQNYETEIMNLKYRLVSLSEQKDDLLHCKDEV